MAKIKLDVTPTLALLLAEQRSNWHVPGAISELVDNSFGPGRGNAKNVHILYDKKSNLLLVYDDGDGIADMSTAFKLGAGMGIRPGDIGIYGAGGTKALLWLGEQVLIETLHQGVFSRADVTWKDLIASNNFQISAEQYVATQANTPSYLYDEGHGTLIQIHLAGTRTFNVDYILRTLAKTYAPALREGRHLRWRKSFRGDFKGPKGAALLLTDPFDDVKFSKSVVLDFEIDWNGTKLGVKGTIGIDSETRSVQESKVSVGYGPRVIITTRDCYDGVFNNEKEHYSGRGIAGWLQLSDGWQTYMSLTKDTFDNKPLYEVLMQRVFEQIRDLLREVEDEQITILIDGLAIQLAQAINSRSDKHVEVTRKARSPLRTVTVKVTDEEGDDANPEHDDEKQQRHKQERKKKTNPTQPLQENGVASTANAVPPGLPIIPVGDAEVSGCLCRVAPSKENITIFINKDHPTVQKSLASTPINREFLYYLVVRELSGCLVDSQHIELIKGLFNEQTCKALDEIDTELQREQYMARLLLDRVQIPVI